MKTFDYGEYGMIEALDTNEPICFADEHGYYVLLTDAQSIIDALTDELERERMRLTACGVVALADTVESAKQAREMHNDYKSASCGDVARRVDECIALRTERDALRKQLAQGDDKPAIPDGFAIVPIEPTIKMLDACLVDGATESQRKVKNVYADIWAKMLAAAR